MNSRPVYRLIGDFSTLDVGSSSLAPNHVAINVAQRAIVGWDHAGIAISFVEAEKLAHVLLQIVAIGRRENADYE